MTGPASGTDVRSQLTDRILTLTLDIICLLTGERCAVVKMAAMEGLLQGLYPPLSGEQSPITAPPPSPTSHRNMEQKILEVISQVIGLLTGETTSRINGNITAKREKSEEENKRGVTGESEYSGHKAAIMEDQPAGCSMKRNLPERCLHPPYFQDSTEEGQEILQQDQVVDLILIKVEGQPETYVSGDQQPVQTSQMCASDKEENASDVTHPERGLRSPSGGGLALPQEWEKENDGLPEQSTSIVPPDLHSKDRSLDSANPTDSPLDRLASKMGDEGPHSSMCPDCGKWFSSQVTYKRHQKTHLEIRPYCCSECGKGFKEKSHLIRHQASHTRECPFSCADCGKRFTTKARFTLHRRYHTGQKVHTCPECGKDFAIKSKLERHLIQHTGDKPFSCSECEYRTAFRFALIIHHRTHTGERPFLCTTCGRTFSQKYLLSRHQKCKKH